MTAKQKYSSQRRRAIKAGIEWKLTFDEWYTWWQQTGHWEERGCSSDSYHMCRYGDTGPYSLDNIYCDKAKNNVAYANKHNPRSGYKHTEESKQTFREVNLHRIKLVKINGTVYEGIREAARQIGISRELLTYRIKTNKPGYEWA